MKEQLHCENKTTDAKCQKLQWSAVWPAGRDGSKKFAALQSGGVPHHVAYCLDAAIAYYIPEVYKAPPI